MAGFLPQNHATTQSGSGDAATGVTLPTLEGHLGWVGAVAFSLGETNLEETNGIHICPFL
jgi:hypothetical protein